MCTMSEASGSTTVVDFDFPCDTRSTPATRERCIQPTAFIQAPSEIDGCPSTSLTLDGTLSTGGGIRPLTYTWTANPRSSDSYYQIAPALAAGGGIDRGVVTLGPAELDKGRRFEVRLVVTSFLGIASTPQSIVVQRAALPVPSISIKAPPVLYLPRSSSVVIQATASIANCFAVNGTGGGTSAISFAWSHEASSGNATVESGAITLDAISSGLRDLVVRGATLVSGVRCAHACEFSNPPVLSAPSTKSRSQSLPLTSAALRIALRLRHTSRRRVHAPRHGCVQLLLHEHPVARRALVRHDLGRLAYGPFQRRL